MTRPEDIDLMNIGPKLQQNIDRFRMKIEDSLKEWSFGKRSIYVSIDSCLDTIPELIRNNIIDEYRRLGWYVERRDIRLGYLIHDVFYEFSLDPLKSDADIRREKAAAEAAKAKEDAVRYDDIVINNDPIPEPKKRRFLGIF